MIPQQEEKYSAEELQLMKTQDIKYVQMKLSTEKKVGWCVETVLLKCVYVVSFARKLSDYRQVFIKLNEARVLLQIPM